MINVGDATRKRSKPPTADMRSTGANGSFIRRLWVRQSPVFARAAN